MSVYESSLWQSFQCVGEERGVLTDQNLLLATRYAAAQKRLIELVRSTSI